MKRTIAAKLTALILCACMLLGLTACSGLIPGDNGEAESKITALETEKSALNNKIAKLEEENAALKNCANGNHSYTCTGSGMAHIYTCSVCDSEGSSTYEYAYDDESTHSFTCDICHETASASHSFETGACVCGLIDSTQMIYAQLNNAVKNQLKAGKIDITILMSAKPSEDMFLAIRRALIDTESVADGSINLTILGATVIPSSAFGRQQIHDDIYDDTHDDMYDRPSQEPTIEIVSELRSVRLPNVIIIEMSAFSQCVNLTEVYAPTVKTLEQFAFSETSLFTAEFPEATSLHHSALRECRSLTSVKLPKATELGEFVFYGSNSIVYMELLASNISLGQCAFNQYDNTNLDLVLLSNQTSNVTFNENGTATWNSYTFKSITLVCTDGTENHDYQYSDNGDGTHDEVCSKCSYVKVDNEKHTAVPDGYDCICGATVIAVIDGTLGGKTEATEEDVNALAEQLKAYLDNGVTTIIVTGEKPAIIDMDSYTNTAIGEAIYRLSGNDIYDETNPYNGKIDLILQDVTEILDVEFWGAFALCRVTLTKVTTIGNGAFSACLHLEKITFNSVVTAINQNYALAFYCCGQEVGGCDLVLNRDQVSAGKDYQPNLETKTWFDTEWKSITLE